ncbi:MAG: hypothetical protein JF606_19150 [Burkholderiales bacterium]|nr:hypothetical protein [Burkholderiales bacterium]
MPADHRRSAAPGTLAPRTAVFPARFGLPHELLEQPDELHLAPPNDAEIGDMIHELLEQPGELHFLAPTQASDVGAALQSWGQTIGTGPDAPAPCPAALLLQANEQAIEAAITLMCRYGLTRETAEHATGLRAGVLAAVVDVQGRWLDHQAQSDAVATMPPAQLQAFLMMLQRVRGNLQHAQTPIPAIAAAAPSSGQSLQKHEVDALIEDIHTRMPRQQGEKAAAAARRIYRANEQVRKLPYKDRIDVLSRVTGANTHDLRAETGLRDPDPRMTPLVEDIRTRVPQNKLEGLTAWALRIHKKDEQVQKLPYKDRISVLALVVGSRETTLRGQPALRDMSGPMAQLAQDIRTRMPQEDYGESGFKWARRIYTTDVRVRDLPYAERISLLAMVTDIREPDLRRDPWLRDMSESMAQQVHEIRMRVPQQDSESARGWAKRIYETDPQVKSLLSSERISVLAMVTGVRETTLRNARIP